MTEGHLKRPVCQEQCTSEATAETDEGKMDFAVKETNDRGVLIVCR